MKLLRDFFSIFLILGHWAEIFGLLAIFLAGLSSLSNLYSTCPAEDSEWKYCFQFFPHRSSGFVQKSSHFLAFSLARSSKLQSFCPDETIQKTFLRKKKQNTYSFFGIRSGKHSFFWQIVFDRVVATTFYVSRGKLCGERVFLKNLIILL